GQSVCRRYLRRTDPPECVLGVSEGSVAAALIVLGDEAGIAALREVTTVVGPPIFIMVFTVLAASAVGLPREQVTITAPKLLPPQLSRRKQKPAQPMDDYR